MAGMGLGMGMAGAGMDRSGLLTYLAEGIKTKIPGAQVSVKDNGIEILFSKEMILDKLFENAGNLRQIAQVEIDTRGIILKINV